MSKTEIYFFSGTGNSLVVAKDIAEKIKGKSIPIPSIIDREKIIHDADIIGIIFPIYYATNDTGIPLMIERFIKKLENIKNKYIFAIGTCGYMYGETMENLKKLIKSRNAKLSSGFVINMSNKSLSYELGRKIKTIFNKNYFNHNDFTNIFEKRKIEYLNKINKISDIIQNQKTTL